VTSALALLSASIACSSGRGLLVTSEPRPRVRGTYAVLSEP